jgi:hypothetical protein
MKLSENISDMQPFNYKRKQGLSSYKKYTLVLDPGA